jgi:hypothetical protein
VATINEAFGTSNQALTITSAATLASNGQASSAAVDNSTNLYLDALVSVKVTTAASGVSATGYVNVYAAGTTDGGTTYGGGEANMGTDHSVTLTSPPNIVLIGVINAVAASTTYWKTAMSVAAAFGGTLPQKWAIVVENKSGAALTACTANYQGVDATAV